MNNKIKELSCNQLIIKKLSIIELFAGIGACSTALKRIGIDLKIVDAVEIDKYAMASFNAIHNTNFEVQDIKTYNKIFENIDLITHGSPCQDFSIAGKQAGGNEDSGTRSSLMYETLRIVEKIKPKYVLWENVKNILSKKHKHNFEKYLEEMERLGYNNYYQVLNAKDYGVPQNRERIYTVSIRKDIDKEIFKFPEKEQLKLVLKDLLENEADGKYYLSNELVKKIKYKFNNENDILGGMQEHQSIKTDGIVPTLTSAMGMGGGYIPMISIKNATKKGYNQALMANDSMSVIENLRIRKLTPKECWRLMGFSDDDFEKAKAVPTSNTQLYKQAGNSIVVNVLEKIFINLFKGEIC